MFITLSPFTISWGPWSDITTLYHYSDRKCSVSRNGNETAQSAQLQPTTAAASVLLLLHVHRCTGISNHRQVLGDNLSVQH